MKNEDFTMTKSETPNGAKFTIKGRVNSTNVTEIQYKLETALKDCKINIVLNMYDVNFLSSAGIRVILKTHKDATKAGGSFGIEKPSENVRNVLGMTALNEMLV